MQKFKLSTGTESIPMGGSGKANSSPKIADLPL